MLLIDEAGVQMGVVKLADAIKLAKERGYDVVEVSPESNPPVTRFLDYGKFKYKQKKKLQNSKGKQHVSRTKEIRLRPGTEKHDLEFKLKHARGFLEKGDKVFVSMYFKDRERKHLDIGKALMQKAIELLADVGTPEKDIGQEGFKLSFTLTPKNSKS
ncbi:MAG: translation initiation factor IF-3 [Planctomycetes bacterium]|nr:translation initiation factor IF-3 [Planctomycetota bacterium]